MADPGHSARRVRKQIFVSRTALDPATGEIVSGVQEGTLRFKLRELLSTSRMPALAGSDAANRNDPNSNAAVRDRLRHTLQDLLDGSAIDPCVIQQILACYCSHGPCGGNGGGGRPIPAVRRTDGSVMSRFMSSPRIFLYRYSKRAL
ncbi:MAG: hypothetical protein IPM81_05095 [Saprospirales bacterium]|nr:hypothetical protein [Saprospirales bacterium]